MIESHALPTDVGAGFVLGDGAASRSRPGRRSRCGGPRRPCRISSRRGRHLRLLSIGYSVVEGGIPIVAAGKIIDSVGVSGVTSQQDARSARPASTLF
jgi:hypothetical protein